MNRTKRIGLSGIVLVMVLIGIFVLRQMRQDKKEKDIGIQIEANGTWIYDEAVSTNAGLLSDLLQEMQRGRLLGCCGCIKHCG